MASGFRGRKRARLLRNHQVLNVSFRLVPVTPSEVMRSMKTIAFRAVLYLWGDAGGLTKCCRRHLLHDGSVLQMMTTLIAGTYKHTDSSELTLISLLPIH